MTQRRVLVVEDDALTRTLLDRACESLGYECRSVATATQARAAWQEGSFSIGLIDLDLGPGPTGIDLARVLHLDRPDARLIILTSYTDIRLVGNLPEIPPDVTVTTKQSVESIDVLRDLLEGIDGSTSPDEDDSLSASQVELLRLVAAGQTNAQIARAMWLSLPGVEKALGRLAQRLNIVDASAHNRRVLLVQEFYRRTGREHAPRS